MGTRRPSKEPEPGDLLAGAAAEPPADGREKNLTDEQVGNLFRALAPSEEMRRQDALLRTAQTLKSRGIDPLAVLIAAELISGIRGVNPVEALLVSCKRKRKGKPARRPRMIELVTAGEISALRDFEEGAYAEYQESGCRSLIEARVFLAEKYEAGVTSGQISLIFPHVKGSTRWLALHRERMRRKLAIPRTQEIYLPLERESVKVSAILQYVRDHVDWLRKK